MIWVGQSGTEYRYEVCDFEGDWKDAPGNYIFAKALPEGRWEAIYIGETHSFKERIPNHSVLPCARRHGFTHVHAHLGSNDRAVRRREESDLIERHRPPCNG